MRQGRVTFILITILISSALIISRLFYLQVINASLYKALAKGQQKIVEQVKGQRGNIYIQDKNNLIALATNKNSKLCFANPPQIENKLRVSKELGKILSLNPESIFKKINTPSKFVILKREISPLEIKNIEELKEKGIGIKDSLIRYYPQHNLASHLLGFVDQDGKGEYGLEGHWDKELKGKENFIEKEKGPLGYFFSSSNSKNSITQGSDLILTIDLNIQSEAEELLRKAYQNLNIRGGQILVLEPKTGKILASAEYPDFDPNKYSQYAKSNLSIFQNSTIEKLYEPGSIFKAITMAIAIDRRKLTPETTYQDKGYVKVDGWTIRNYGDRVWGKENMTQVLEHSINTGAVFAGSKIDHKTYLKYLSDFGLFSKTGIGLSSEVTSQNENLKKGSEVNFDTSYFGQGIDMTPLQIARAYCVLANGGNLVQPYIVKEIIKPNGKIIKHKSGNTLPKVISTKTASDVTRMLIDVTEKGYSRGARIPGYYIASKTGTANIPYSCLKIKKTGYSPETWQSFVGYFPALDPSYLILVKLDNPEAKTASVSAAPIFKELAQYIINYEQITPDYNLNSKNGKPSQNE